MEKQEKKLGVQLFLMLAMASFIVTLGIILTELEHIRTGLIFAFVGYIEIFRAVPNVYSGINGNWHRETKIEQYLCTVKYPALGMFTLIAICIMLDIGLDKRNDFKVFMIVLVVSILYCICAMAIVAAMENYKLLEKYRNQLILGEKWEWGFSCEESKEEASPKDIEKELKRVFVKYFKACKKGMKKTIKKNKKQLTTGIIAFLLGTILLDTSLIMVGRVLLVISLGLFVYCNIYVNPKLARRNKERQQKIKEIKEKAYEEWKAKQDK